MAERDDRFRELRWFGAPPSGVEESIRLALREDLGHGDLSSAALSPSSRAEYYIEIQASGRLCGLPIAQILFPDAALGEFKDGDAIQAGDVILRGQDRAGEVLSRERTALNFLMHLSGISTLTAKYVEAIAGTGARIVDTRKTTPGLRSLEKYAVRCGGASNHRHGLDDGAMIKDNHIRAFGSIADAVSATRAVIPHTVKIEVECESGEQVTQAIAAGAEIVMLDNISPEEMAKIVSRHKGEAIFEASGGINLQSVRAAAESGVDLISVGAITHSAPALSLHMEFELV